MSVCPSGQTMLHNEQSARDSVLVCSFLLVAPHMSWRSGLSGMRPTGCRAPSRPSPPCPRFHITGDVNSLLHSQRVMVSNQMCHLTGSSCGASSCRSLRHRDGNHSLNLSTSAGRGGHPHRAFHEPEPFAYADQSQTTIALDSFGIKTSSVVRHTHEGLIPPDTPPARSTTPRTHRPHANNAPRALSHRSP